MKKRIFFSLLTLMLLGLFAVPVIAASTVIATGACGPNLTWTLYDDDLLEISGTGVMDNWASDTVVPWYNYRSVIKTVKILDGVTSVGRSAFRGCTALTSITIPDSITSIGDGAFRCCTSLKSITIPDSVTSVGNAAFENCTSLTSIAIPDSVTSIGDSAFSYCTSLTGITFLGNAPTLGNYVFNNTPPAFTIYRYEDTTGWDAADFSGFNIQILQRGSGGSGGSGSFGRVPQTGISGTSQLKTLMLVFFALSAALWLIVFGRRRVERS